MKTSHFLTPTESRSAMRPLPTKAKSALRPLILFGLSALAIFLSATAGLRADPIVLGTQGFNAAGSVITPNTGDVTTATVFDFGNFGTTSNQTGIFAGMPTQLFGPVSLNITIPTGLAFGNSVFGAFTSSSNTPVFIGFNTASFLEDGLWTPGTFPGFSGLTGGPFTTKLLLSFTQVGGPGTAVSFSGSFSASKTPEPSSIVMVLTGLIAGVVMFRLRRSRCNLVMG